MAISMMVANAIIRVLIRMKHSNKLLIVILMSIIFLGYYLLKITDPYTPYKKTITAIGETFTRISIYAETTHKIPYSFDVLPIRNGYSNRIIDAWGRTLLLKIENDNIMSLVSYGKDGVPGGDGDDADIIISYWLKRPDGSLWIGDRLWIVKAEIKHHN